MDWREKWAGGHHVPTVEYCATAADNSKSTRTTASALFGFANETSQRTPLCSNGILVAECTMTPDPGNGSLRRPASYAAQRVLVATTILPSTIRRPQPKGVVGPTPQPAKGGSSSELIANISTGRIPSGEMPTAPQKLLIVARSRCSPPTPAGTSISAFGSTHKELRASIDGRSAATTGPRISNKLNAAVRRVRAFEAAG